LTYEERTYRSRSNTERFTYLRVIHEETDLWIGVPVGTDTHRIKNEVRDSIAKLRKQVTAFIDLHPEFATSYEPLSYSMKVPDTISSLLEAASVSGTGPMAGIAGLFAGASGHAILQSGCSEVVVENGGDIFASTKEGISVAIYAGQSPLSDRISLRIGPGRWGICTSSGTVGHSMNFGKADAVAVVAKDPVLADTMATAISNRVRTADDIQPVLDDEFLFRHIEGAVVILGDTVGIKGNLELA
jgi:ApbE superfamily uncharacterized protein (UPF0280 family)